MSIEDICKLPVKELADEIEGLSIIELASLTEALEEKLGASRKSQDSFWVDDRVFVMGYDVIITGWAINRLIAAKNIWYERILPDFFPSNGFVDIAKFLVDVPITVYEFLPADEALELRSILMQAGLTVRLNHRWTYFSYYKYSQLNEHQQHMFTNPPDIPDLCP